MNVDTKSIEILKMEYTQACSKLVYLDDQANKYVSYMLTAAAALAAFLALLIHDDGISNYMTFSIIISSGTLLIGLLIIMTLHHTVQCFRLGGYIQFLEEQINQAVTSPLLNWESEIAPKYIHKDITTSFIYAIMGLIFLVLLMGAGFAAVTYILPQWPGVSLLILTLIVLELITGLIYLAKIGTVHEKIYLQLAQKVKKPESAEEPSKAE